jgi:hypothetical protein
MCVALRRDPLSYAEDPVTLCGHPMYDADGSPKCALPRLHIWNGVSLGDDHNIQVEGILISWVFTYCWQFHDDEQRASGWNCTEPRGHVTEPLSSQG